MKALFLLLSLREGASLNMLEARLASEGQRLRSALQAHLCRQRRGIRIPDDPFASTEHGSAVPRVTFAAAVQVLLDDDTPTTMMVSTVDGMGKRLADWIDASQSAALICEHHAITSGSAPLWLVYVMRRRPDLTHDEFSDYWLNTHAAFGEAAGALGYCQDHADLAASAEACAAAGVGITDIDGIAESRFQDIAHFQRLMSQPSVAEDALEDETRFVDHGKTIATLTRVAYEFDE